MKKVLVSVVIRKGRKIVKSFNLSKESVSELLADIFSYDASKATGAWDTLREGNKYKLKLDGHTVTLEPLHNHIDHY